jgi:hypothetical protein
MATQGVCCAGSGGSDSSWSKGLGPDLATFYFDEF